MANSSFKDEGLKWYVIHTYTGYENKVKANLDKMVDNRNLREMIVESLIPVETVVEKVVDKNDKNKVTEKITESKLYPSYVFVRMHMTDETWHVVRNIAGVTGFVGPGSCPMPLLDEEVISMGIENTVTKLSYVVGDTVSVQTGEFEGYIGTVTEISADCKKVKILAFMFGGQTEVELDADRVQKLEM